MKQAKNLVAWKQSIGQKWGQVKVLETKTDHAEVTESRTESDSVDSVKVGEFLTINSTINLGEIKPEDVTVEVIHGLLDSNHNIVNYSVDALKLVSSKDGVSLYEGEIPCTKSGQQGFSVRVVPCHQEAALPQELSLISWEG